MTVLISLIGEQPIPNLLPIKHFQPAATLAVYSDLTTRAAGRLEKLVAGTLGFWPLLVDAYDIQGVTQAVLAEIGRKSLRPGDLVFNITGGTKPMSLAAYLAAQALGSPVVYLQSEKKRSRLFRYEFSGGVSALVEDCFLPALICIEDYLRAHVESFHDRQRFTDDAGHRFEQAVYQALAPVLDETRLGVNLGGAVDIDLVVRCENQVGIIETKLGSNGLKKAIDQLNTAGGREYLGIYTQKFLVSDQDWAAFGDLKALAQERLITLIQLPGYGRDQVLSEAEAGLLRSNILKGLGRASGETGQAKPGEPR